MILNLSYKGKFKGFMRILPRTELYSRHGDEPAGSGVEFSLNGESWFDYQEGLCVNGMAMQWDEVMHLIGVE